MDEVLQQILTELKDIKESQAALEQSVKESQAVVEREVREVKASQEWTQLKLVVMDRREAVLEKGQIEINKRLDSLEERLGNLQKDVTILRGGMAVIEDDHGRLLQGLVEGQTMHDEELSDIRLLNLERVQ